MQIKIHVIGSCLLFLLLAACGSKVNQANFDKIKSGKTTQQEAIDIFGKPDETATRPGPSTWSRMIWRDDKAGKRIVLQFEGDTVLIPYFDKGDEG